MSENVAFQIVKEPMKISANTVSFSTDRHDSPYVVKYLSSMAPNHISLSVYHQRSGNEDWSFTLELSKQDWQHIGSPMAGDLLNIRMEITGRG